ncbi:MAG: DUF4123 domain-containing protein [Paracoccus sp. (in: a-proteobacteria)]|nr:DUF4123 domain-containing protein [Paracoccus sp. (in: a-proteobacteria)]
MQNSEIRRELVHRIPLSGNIIDALKPLLFGVVRPRSRNATIIAGDGTETAFHTYLLIEAARRPDIETVLQGFGVQYMPLYQGASADRLARHAPYLAKVENQGRAAEWLIRESWGQGWGVWLRSTRNLGELRQHFRKFTQLYNPTENRWYIFRFYSPEVARRTIPSLPPRQYGEFLQGIAALIAATEDGKAAVMI